MIQCYIMLKAVAIPLVLFLAFSGVSVTGSAATAKTDAVPDRIKIDLPMILKGTLNTAQFKKLQLELLTKDSARLRITSQLDPQVGAAVTLQHSNAQVEAGPAALDSMQHYQLKLSHRRLLETGTALSAEWLLERRSANFSAVQLPDSSNYQSQFAFSVKQSLGRNRWGKSFHSQLEAARLQGLATEDRVEVSSEKMLMGIVEIYHRAWLLRERLNAARRGLTLQWRLQQVVKTKSELGTAEESHLLRVKSAVLVARQRVYDTKKMLRDIWYQLVIPLHLPRAYLDIDVAKIDIALVREQEFAISTCQEWQRQNFSSLQSSPQLDFYQKSQQALQHRFAVQKDKLYPDIFVALRLANNGVNKALGTSLIDSVLPVNLSLALSAGIDFTIDNHAARLDLKDTVQQQLRLDLDIAQHNDNVRLNALTMCDRVQRLLAKEKILRRLLYNNGKRIKLLQEKFELGQSEVDIVIQAQLELIDIEMQLQQVVQDIALSAWKIRANAGQVLSYLRGMLQQ